MTTTNLPEVGKGRGYGAVEEPIANREIRDDCEDQFTAKKPGSCHRLCLAAVFVLGLGLVVGLALGLVGAGTRGQAPEWEQFLEWQKEFDKSYPESEIQMRFQTFRESLKAIDALQSSSEASLLGECSTSGTAQFGLTKFSDLTDEEFAAQYLTTFDEEHFMSLDLGNQTVPEAEAPKQDQTAEEQWDDCGAKCTNGPPEAIARVLRENADLSNASREEIDELRREIFGVAAVGDGVGDDSLFPNQLVFVCDVFDLMKDQGSCGSCWAFAAVAVIEERYKNKYGRLAMLSEQQLVDCTSASNGCNGGSSYAAWQYTQKRGGVAHWLNYPYTASDHSCRDGSVPVVSGTAPTYIGSSSGRSYGEYHIAAMVERQGAHVVYVNAKNWKYYKEGIMSACGCGSGQTNHAVALVGYMINPWDDVYFWMIKNSWGRDWGVDGYIFLSFGENTCEVSKYAYYIQL